MNTNTTLIDVEQARNRWGCFLALGVILLGSGITALAFIPVNVFGSVSVLGWLMLASGLLEAIYAFCVRDWGGVPLHALGAVLGISAGLVAVMHPIAGGVVWTLCFAAYFTVIGIFRMLAAVQLQHRSRGWAILDGAVTLVLGLLLWAEWPDSAIWFLGFAFGILLILRGCAMVMFALAVRGLETHASDKQSRVTGLRIRPLARGATFPVQMHDAPTQIQPRRYSKVS